MIKAEYKTKDQNWKDEQTTYWFEIISSDSQLIETGEIYGYYEEPDSFLIVVCDNVPVTPEKFHELEDALLVTKEMRME